jgi:hypothetical protein
MSSFPIDAGGLPVVCSGVAGEQASRVADQIGGGGEGGGLTRKLVHG